MIRHCIITFLVLLNLLSATALELKNNHLSLTLSPQGAALTGMEFKGKSMTIPGYASFTDILMYNRGKEQVQEKFSGFEFDVVSVESSQIIFSTRGRAAFDWLRLTKTYSLVKGKPEFTITYTLRNLDEKPHQAGFRTMNFLARDYQNKSSHSVFQPRRKKVAKLLQPGNTTHADEFSLNPSKAFIAFRNNDDNHGAIIKLPPESVDSYYSWFSKRDNLFTMEYFLRELELKPGQSVSFAVSVECFAVPPSFDLPEVTGEGNKMLLPLKIAQTDTSVTESEPATGTMPSDGEFFDITGLRQFMPSVRSARLPEKFNAERIGVYELENNHARRDKPIPFRVKRLGNGELQVLFKVPGTNHEGYYYTAFVNGRTLDKRRRNKDLGAENFKYRILLNDKNPMPQDQNLIRPDIVYNGSFEKKADYGDWPDGYFWNFHARHRNQINRHQGSVPDGKYCMEATRPEKNNDHFPIFFRLEPQVKYTASAMVKSENPPAHWAVVALRFYDANGKQTVEPKQIYLTHDKTSYDWKELSTDFYSPEGAVFGAFIFAAYGPDQKLFFDDVRIVPDDQMLTPKSPREILRDQLTSGWYKPLDLLEKISHSTVTPHEKWFIPSSFTMPEILYLPTINESNEDPTRRLIVELAQRMEFKYRYIPLLRRINKMRGPHYGVHYPVQYDNILEPYTIQCLKEIEKPSQVVIVQYIDLKNQVQEEFIDILSAWQNKGSKILFIDCLNIPEKLLGAPVPSAEFWQVPIMRQISLNNMAKACSLYENAAIFNMAQSTYYLNLRNFPCVPSDMLLQKFPDYYGREFPYWEYMYLPLLKTLRHLGGVKPDVIIKDFNEKTLQIEAIKEMPVKLVVSFKDLHRYTDQIQETKYHLKSGINVLNLTLPPLPGGDHITEYRLLDTTGKVLDAGAYHFKTAETVKIENIEFAAPDRIFTVNAPVEFKVTVSNAPPTTKLSYMIEDSNFRVVAQGTLLNSSASIQLHPPFVTLYRLLVKAEDSERILAKRWEEFSVPQINDPTEVKGIMWIGRKEMNHLLKTLGFDMSIVNFSHSGVTNGSFRSLRNLNLEPIPIGIGHTVYKNFKTYKSDAISAPIRNPCFSDPELQKENQETLKKIIGEQQYNYFNIRNHLLSDESSLGQSVCFSPHCLKSFRKYLQQQYSSLDTLNNSWQSDFKNWDDVVPCQFSELKNTANPGQWLDHKIFMCRVFAHEWLGKTVKIIEEASPGAKAGLSGTQNPGYSYDWVQMMKHINFICYYGGIQGRQVHDFASRQITSGQWGGGYTHAHIPYEAYNQNIIWNSLLQGANLMAHWHGAAVNGDITATENLEFYCNALNETKQGIGKMILSATQEEPEIAIVYSHPSCFASFATIGNSDFINSLNGWKAMLDDLKLPFKFISYESLAKSVPSAKVLILPCALALSDTEITNIGNFAANGGVVVADIAPGYFDEHGKRQDAKIFGPKPAEFKLRAIEKDQCTYRILSPEQKIMAEYQHGKGKISLLNYIMSSYQEVNLGGVGGEDSTIKTGSQVFCSEARRNFTSILKDISLKPQIEVNDATGKIYSCTTRLWQDGDNHIVGIHRYSREANRFKDISPDEIQVTLPISGYIYDVRQGQFITKGNQFKARLYPGSALIYTVLKEKNDSITLEAPKTLSLGENCKLKVSSGKSAQIFHLTVFNPEGDIDQTYSANYRFINGSGEIELQFPYNALPGNWTVKIKNVNTGLTDQKILHLNFFENLKNRVLKCDSSELY